jgi:hypothetical protein
MAPRKAPGYSDAMAPQRIKPIATQTDRTTVALISSPAPNIIQRIYCWLLVLLPSARVTFISLLAEGRSSRLTHPAATTISSSSRSHRFTQSHRKDSAPETEQCRSASDRSDRVRVLGSIRAPSASNGGGGQIVVVVVVVGRCPSPPPAPSFEFIDDPGCWRLDILHPELFVRLIASNTATVCLRWTAAVLAVLSRSRSIVSDGETCLCGRHQS